METTVTWDWERQLFLSVTNFVLAVPLHLLPGIYDRTTVAYKQLVAVTSVRLCCLYVGVVTLLYELHWSIPFGLLSASVMLYAVEFYATRVLFSRAEKVTFTTDDRVKEFGLFCLVSLDVLNFVTDSTAQTEGWVPFYTHVAQILVRSVTILVLVVIELSWKTYEKAWSCYIHGTPIADYTQGYCPAYTHDYGMSWACAAEGVAKESVTCRDMDITPAWSEKPKAWHISVFMLILLYGFHAVGLILDFKTKRMMVRV